MVELVGGGSDINRAYTLFSFILTFNIFYYSPPFYVHGHDSVMSEIAMLNIPDNAELDP